MFLEVVGVVEIIQQNILDLQIAHLCSNLTDPVILTV